MNKRLCLILIASSCFFVGLWVASPALNSSIKVRAQQSEPNETGLSQDNWFERINKRARVAQHGDLREARDLADAVIEPYTTGSPILNSDGTLGEVKDRLARAEVEYRKHRGHAIPEENVVRLVNALVKKFGAPEYAKSDRYEVRRQRMALFVLTPALTTIERASIGKEGNRRGGGLSPKLSPLEAANVAMSLVYQKIFNDEYHQDASERQATGQARRALQSERSASSAREPSARTREMLDIAIKGSLPLLSAEQRNRFAHRSLDILGIQR